MTYANATRLTPVALGFNASVNPDAVLTSPDLVNGNKFVADRNTLVLVRATAQSVLTFDTPGNVLGLAIEQPTITVAINTAALIHIGKLLPVFDQNAGGDVFITATGTFTIKVYQPSNY